MFDMEARALLRGHMEWVVRVADDAHAGVLQLLEPCELARIPLTVAFRSSIGREDGLLQAARRTWPPTPRCALHPRLARPPRSPQWQEEQRRGQYKYERIGAHLASVNCPDGADAQELRVNEAIPCATRPRRAESPRRLARIDGPARCTAPAPQRLCFVDRRARRSAPSVSARSGLQPVRCSRPEYPPEKLLVCIGGARHWDALPGIHHLLQLPRGPGEQRSISMELPDRGRGL